MRPLSEDAYWRVATFVYAVVNAASVFVSVQWYGEQPRYPGWWFPILWGAVDGIILAALWPFSLCLGAVVLALWADGALP